MPMIEHLVLVTLAFCLQELLKEQESNYEVSIFIIVNKEFYRF